MNEKNISISVDFAENAGPIKCMNAVNNGPLSKHEDPRWSNYETYKAARIPYARNHDASFFSDYGGEHTVDVHAIFPDFDKDVNDPASYDFYYTDKYLNRILSVGTKIVYRLGTKIEKPDKGYASIPPKDFNKWAEICEHIVMHYNDGWADGFYMDIEYWEIWNEPDGIPNWKGTPEQYYDLYIKTATRLKKRFPNIKIGTAFAYPGASDFKVGFFEALKNHPEKVPMDFHGTHGYLYYPAHISFRSRIEQELIEKYGYGDAEIVISEYNHAIKNGGMHEKILDTIIAINGIQGATFTAGAMLEGQNSPLNMLMYYDARPSALNGMFDFYTRQPLKGYYPFVMFAHLRELGTQIKSVISGQPQISTEDNACDITVSAVFATNGTDEAAMISHFPGEEPCEMKVKINLQNAKNSRFSLYLLDEAHTMEKTGEVEFVNGEAEITMPPMSTVLLATGELK